MGKTAGQKAAEDPRIVACFDFARRMGAKSVQMRYSDDMEPVVWITVATINHRGDYLPANTGEHEHHFTASALSPLGAAGALVEEMGDGGTCRHCGRTTGVSLDWQREHPLAEHVCWHVYDPETQKFRRSCEGDVPKLGRNDPCYCGSGKKFKNCHAA